MQSEAVEYKIPTCDATRERIELRAVAYVAEELIRVQRLDSENAERPPGWLNQPGHQVHKRGLAGTVRADQTRDSGWQGQ